MSYVVGGLVAVIFAFMVWVGVLLGIKNDLLNELKDQKFWTDYRHREAQKYWGLLMDLRNAKPKKRSKP